MKSVFDVNKNGKSGASKYWAGLLVVFLLVSFHSFAVGDGRQVLLGAAQADITPPVGYRMAGYFEERPSTGIHDPLQAKVLVLKQGPEKIALVFCDLLGVSLNVSSRVRLQASNKTGIPVQNIMICASHAHTGPLFDDVMRDYYHEKAFLHFGQDKHEEVYYPDVLVGALVTAIVSADKKTVPVELAAGFGNLEGLSFNRRFHMTNGTVQFNPGLMNPAIVGEAGPVDHGVGILTARNTDGKPVAGITVFACHCDTTGGTRFSADYPYYLAGTLKGVFGANYVSAFGAGTCGDINHIDIRAKEALDRSIIPVRLGTNLANSVIQAIPALREISRPRLKTLAKTLHLPLQEVTREEAEMARKKLPSVTGAQGAFFEKVTIAKTLDLAKMGPTWPMEVQVFRFDDSTALVCLPGEIFVELGLEIKKRSPFATTFVLSICNDDRPSYVPTLKAFSEGSYEVANSRVKPGGGEKLVAAALDLLGELKNQ